MTRGEKINQMKSEAHEEILLAGIIQTQARLAEAVADLTTVLEKIADGRNIPATVNVEGAAKLIGVEPKTIRNWASNGKIPHHRVNGALFFVVSEILAVDGRKQKE